MKEHRPTTMYVTIETLIMVCVLVSVRAQQDIRLPPRILPAPDTPSHILYITDSEVTLPCVATGSPAPVYQWILNGIVLDNPRNIHVSPDPNVGTIRIQPIISLDEGYYQCRATNIYGTSVSKVFFVQRVVFGRYPPTPVQDSNINEGMSLKLACLDIKSVPKASYNWALMQSETDMNPESLARDRRVIMDENGNLYFSYVTKEDAKDSKMYTCRVFNSHLDITTGGSYSRIIVNDGDQSPKAPTLLYTTPSPQVAVFGSRIRLQCIFAGMPEVSVTWEPMPAGKSDTDEHGTVLEIDYVQFSDEAKYTCTGTNSAGSMSKEIRLDVQSPPEFVTKLSDLNGTEMDSVSMECRTRQDTEPPATIQWYINGDQIDSTFPGPRTEISDNGQRLNISNLCKDCPGGGSDIQVIQCNASNVHGYVFSEGYLNVLLRTIISNAPHNHHVDNETTSVTFDCEARSDESTPVTILWEKDGRGLPAFDTRLVNDRASNSLIVNLDGLSLDEMKKYEGTYTCTASNGYSSQSMSAELTIEDNEPMTTMETTEASKSMKPYGPSSGMLMLLSSCLLLSIQC